jgi:hypothetical protein
MMSTKLIRVLLLGVVALGLSMPATAAAVGSLASRSVGPVALIATDPSSTTPDASPETGTTVTTTTGSTTTAEPPSETQTAVTTTPAPDAPAAAGPTTTTTTDSTPASTAPVTPQVQAQSPQPVVTSTGSGKGRTTPHHVNSGSSNDSSPTGGKSAKHSKASSPSTLTPPFPTTLSSSVSGVSDFFIESFRIPPFLLPIYQAAGTAYDIPWQVLAAINEVETDYGRDLSVSNAGAEGWMQFLPSSWAQYGMDANGDGFKDPYNPADAIFAAARYLQAAGGTHHIQAAIFSYNHSQSYVDSVMLRAQLLEGTPPELLNAITGLTESRFPVHAPSHFADGFPSIPGQASGTLAGTTIYSPVGAPVIAVQDGRVVKVGQSPALGRYVSLRDAFGNTYTYARLGSVASLYPVLEPRQHTSTSTRISRPDAVSQPPPSGPASAGIQPRSPMSEGAVSSELAMGAAAGLEGASTTPAATPPPAAATPSAGPDSTPRVFRSGSDEVYLHPLLPGVQVIAGTVLGHVGGGEPEPSAAATLESATPVAGNSAPANTAEGHMVFQIRPAGVGAPAIDPKPILDGWVGLENTSIFRAKGENPFLATSPTTGQVLLESKQQLEQQVLADPGIHIYECGRQDIQTGQIDRRVLATLEFLSVSGLKPTVSALKCGHSELTTSGNVSEHITGDAVDISAVNGIPIEGNQGAGSITDTTIRKLLTLQGAMKPHQIISLMSYPGTDNTLAMPDHYNHIHVGFAPVFRGAAQIASATASTLTPAQWIKLVARLGEIPEPTVVSKHSAAAIPDEPSPPSSGDISGEH